ncbi:MAG: ATP-binding protein [Candidatus Omnitrophota bacterium]|nr:hypothetical protein [Candidatus Omnitrophota bacterium]
MISGKEEEQRIYDLSLFPEENPYPVLRVKSDSNVIYANAPAKSILDAWSAKPGGLLPGKWMRYVTGALSDNTVGTVETVIGNSIYFLNIVPVKRRGYVNIYAQDITKQRLAEEREKTLAVNAARMAAEKEKRIELEKAYAELKSTQDQLIQAEKFAGLGHFAATLAHELNNPLTGLFTMLKVYKRRVKESDKEYEEIGDMLSAVEHMINIVKGLKMFVRKDTVELYPTDIGAVLEDVVTLSDSMIKQNNISLRMDTGREKLRVMADKNQLQQVIMNLISNAVCSMPEGGVLSVEGIKRDKKAVITIKDTGCGIKKEDIPRLFDPFFTTKPPGEGIGLGLSVSYGIIKRHSGNIEVKSTLGKGTEVSVVLPAL